MRRTAIPVSPAATAARHDGEMSTAAIAGASAMTGPSLGQPRACIRVSIRSAGICCVRRCAMPCWPPWSPAVVVGSVLCRAGRAQRCTRCWAITRSTGGGAVAPVVPAEQSWGVGVASVRCWSRRGSICTSPSSCCCGISPARPTSATSPRPSRPRLPRRFPSSETAGPGPRRGRGVHLPNAPGLAVPHRTGRRHREVTGRRRVPRSSRGADTRAMRQPEV
jgi:hypothetical protein